MINQKIVIMTSIEGLSPAEREQIANDNVQICNNLGLTGRVYVQRRQGLSIVEGESALTDKYITALKRDPRVKGFVEHTSRMIPAREFEDYCVGIDVEGPSSLGAGVHVLTPEFLKLSMPANPSPRIKMMVQAYLEPMT